MLVRRAGHVIRGDRGYVLILAMLVLTAVGMLAATLITSVLTNQQHVTRDRSYTQSLAVAEAGLNQYLWMVASGTSSQSNGFAIAGNTGPDPRFKQFDLTDIYYRRRPGNLCHQSDCAHSSGLQRIGGGDRPGHLPRRRTQDDYLSPR